MFSKTEESNYPNIPLDLKRINQAFLDNDVDYIKRLISLIDVNSKLGPNKITLLEFAIEQDKIGIFNLLIENQADVNVFSNNEGTPLMCALYKKNIEMMQLLISSGANINLIAGRLEGRMLPERYAGSALHIAAKEGLLEPARILLENGADLNAKKIPNRYSKCYTPLDLAINEEKKDLFDLFIEHEDKISLDVLEHALIVALDSGEEYYVLELLRVLNNRNCNSSVRTNAKFVLSVFHNNLAEAIELIHDVSIEINKLKFGSYLLTQHAAKHDNLNMLKLLISSGADRNGKELNHDWDSPLTPAAVYNSLSVLSFLLEHPHRRSELNHALYQAVLCGHFDCVKLLVEAGGDINHKPCHESILTISIQKGYNKITGYLLSKNATLSLVNHKGVFSSQTTPFHAALNNNNMGFFAGRYGISHGTP
ncbi:MAG: ankyrin repeat domain-containing protein [Tatlockia sp.]|nr:ankyrin repeat domain-containing protein [Tatlockia sp.]